MWVGRIEEPLRTASYLWLLIVNRSQGSVRCGAAGWRTERRLVAWHRSPRWSASRATRSGSRGRVPSAERAA